MVAEEMRDFSLHHLFNHAIIIAGKCLENDVGIGWMNRNSLNRSGGGIARWDGMVPRARNGCGALLYPGGDLDVGVGDLWDKPQQQWQKKWLSQDVQGRLSARAREILALDDPLNDQLCETGSGVSGFMK